MNSSKSGAKSKPSPASTPAGAKAFLPSTWVSCELNEDEKAYIRAHLLSLEDVEDRVEELVREGYGFSIGYDERADCLSIFMNAKTVDIHKGLSLSARAPSLQGAFTSLFYKHFEKLHEDWTTAKARQKLDVWG